MPRLEQRRRGPRRRQTGAEPVTNPFEALQLLYSRDPIPEDEQAPEYRARVASARRLLNRNDLEKARKTLAQPEPEEDYLRFAYELHGDQALAVVAHSEAHPEEFWVDTHS